MFVYTQKCIGFTEILAEPQMRPCFRLFFQYMNTEESLNIKGWTVFLYLYTPKCMKFCHISYRPEIAKNFHRWNTAVPRLPAVLHIFPNEKMELNHTSKYFLSEYVKKLAQLLHSGGACILYLKNISPNISNFCGLGRLRLYKSIFSKNLQLKNRVFIQKNIAGHRYSAECSDFIILSYFNKRRTPICGGRTYVRDDVRVWEQQFPDHAQLSTLYR